MKKNRSKDLNVVVLGVSLFDDMASSMRVKNLLSFIIDRKSHYVSNIIYFNEADSSMSKEGTQDGITYSIIQIKAKNFLSFITFYLRGSIFLLNRKGNSTKNILYTYGYPDIKNIFFLIFAKAIGYKIIIDIVEDNRYYEKFSNKFNKLKVKSSLFLIKKSHLFSHYIITISNHLYDLMSQITKNKIPIKLIPISVDLNKFSDCSFNKPNIYKLFYGGSFGEKDGLEYLLAAFDELCKTYNNIELILTGRPSSTDSFKLEKLLKTCQHRSKITFKGYVDKEMYYMLLKESDILCMTRINSNFASAGFPFKLGEFLAAGKAIIATRVGDVPLYLQSNLNSILIKPSSSVDIIAAVTYILENPIKIKLLGMEAKKVAEKNFDKNKLSKELNLIFNQL